MYSHISISLARSYMSEIYIFISSIEIEMIVITWKFGCLDYTLSSASDVA